ncbi:MAG TPA: hypothetical protein VGM13_16145 [Thermoanaerobaculia bacterium]|jgi:hypothetical protein
MPRARILLVAAALAAVVAAVRPASGEDAFTRTGVFRHLVEDDFAGPKSLDVYELETDEGDVLQLRFASPPAARTGERVSVTGWPGRRAFEVDEIHSVGPGRTALGRTALSSWTTGPKRVLVMLLNFTNDTSMNATTVTNAQNLFFGTGSSVARYYAEASYGLATMTGDVVLVTATVPKPATCDTGTVASQANAQALAAGKNPANYDFPVWVFAGIGACGWNGLGYVGGGGSWINGTGSMGLLVAAHELGHNFGVLHAHSYTCPSAAIAPAGCTRSEYGDRFDTMGNSRAGHFNAQFKDTFGWLPAGSVRNHPGGSVTYTLDALETPGGFAYAVRIPTTKSDRTYWIEWRSRAGFDSGFPAGVANGALIRFAPSSVGGADLLDMNFATAGSFDDAQLDVGKSFTDPELALTITAVSKTASSLTIQVDYGTPPAATSFHTVQPCRVFDTRNANGTYGGPTLYAGQARSWVVRGRCGIPATAKSIAGNLTATGSTAAGSVRLVPGGAPPTGTGTVAFRAGQTRANNVTMPLGASGDVVVDGLPAGTAHVILDVVGWFE